MESYFRQRNWAKNVKCEKNLMKKNSFCLPSENLVQNLPRIRIRTGSGSAFVKNAGSGYNQCGSETLPESNDLCDKD
jgi:hypothetical protein